MRSSRPASPTSASLPSRSIRAVLSSGMAPMANQEDLLDRKETFRGPAVSSAILHLAVAGTFIGLALVSGLFNHNTWGDATSGGAISATLVSSASLPLPQDHPPTDSVLATERPSPATAPPQPKAIQQPDETAIPLAT